MGKSTPRDHLIDICREAKAHVVSLAGLFEEVLGILEDDWRQEPDDMPDPDPEVVKRVAEYRPERYPGVRPSKD